jgi:hypothetical protein
MRHHRFALECPDEINVNPAELSHPIVRAAIEAINTNDRQAWFDLFTDDAALTDDGDPRDFRDWSDSELFGSYRCRVDAINREEADGTLIHADFHSGRWGDFKTFMKFTLKNNRIVRLDVGQET